MPCQFTLGHSPGFGIASAEYGGLIGLLQFEQASLAGGVGLKTIVAIKVVRRDIQQRRHVTSQRMGQVDLIAGQLQNIDSTRRQRRLS